MATDTPNDGKLVIRKLVEYIRTERLSTGDRLPPIPQLAQMWDTGKNVVRDGLLKAQNMGLIKIHPRLGTFVQSPDFSPLIDSLEDILDAAMIQEEPSLLYLISARRMVETEAVVKAAESYRPEDLLQLREALAAMQDSENNRDVYIQADEKFHLAIARAAGNPVLLIFLKVLLVALRPHRISMLISDEGKTYTARVHQELYQHIMEHDTARARELIEEHIEHSNQLVLSHLSTLPPV